MQNGNELTIASIVVTVVLSVVNAATEAVQPRGRRIGLIVVIGVVLVAILLSVFWRLSPWIIGGGVLVVLAWILSPHVTRTLAATIELGRASKSLGILRLESTIENGGTDTEAIMASAANSIDVVAFAGSKFLTRYEELEAVARGGKGCRFVLVDPTSDAVKELSERWGYEGNRLAEIISQNLSEVRHLREKGYRIDVRFVPCNLLRFRLVIVDQNTAYISYYRPATRGLDLPQLVVQTSEETGGRFVAELLALFEDVWNCGSEVRWSDFPVREPTQQAHA